VKADTGQQAAHAAPRYLSLADIGLLLLMQFVWGGSFVFSRIVE